ISSIASSHLMRRAISALIVCASFTALAQNKVLIPQPSRGPSPFGSSSALLIYNAESGNGVSALLDSAGNYQYLSNLPGFAKGWTHVVGARNGALLFYNASTGDGAIARFNSAGAYQFVKSVPGFARGWTHVVSPNTGVLLFYNAESGNGV